MDANQNQAYVRYVMLVMSNLSPRQYTVVFATMAVVASLLATVGSVAGATKPRATFRPSVQACEALVGAEVGASRIGHRTSGAVVDEATFESADAEAGLPEYCQIKAHVEPADPSSYSINIQVNMPSEWSGRSLQFGGGGFNGTLVSGLDNIAGTTTAFEEPASPIERNYATIGDDGGTGGDAVPGYFGTDAEALANYGGQAVKKTRDTAQAILAMYYGRQARWQYFAGGSKGGHEGLVAAQRYGRDFDGIIAYYPANQNQAMVIAWRAIENLFSRPGGALEPESTALLADAVMAACDGLDRIEDGVIANTRGCARAFDVDSLLCEVADVSVPGECLSATQVETVRGASSPFRFAFDLHHGVRGIGGWPYLQGADLGVTSVPLYRVFTEPVIRFFIGPNPVAGTAFDHSQHQDRIQELSRLLDATDPTIDDLISHRGKLLLVQGTTDFLVTDSQTSALYERMRARYGTAQLRRSVRYYVQAGYGHGDGVFNVSWDSLTALERWSERGKPPKKPIAYDGNEANGNRSMPLCEYPTWPRHRGGGVTAADFRCVGASGNRTRTTVIHEGPSNAGVLTASVRGFPRVESGLVEFRIDRRLVATEQLQADGTASHELVRLTPGSHRVVARFVPVGFPARTSTSRVLTVWSTSR